MLASTKQQRVICFWLVTCFCRKPPYRLAVASVTSAAAATRLARALAAAAAALPVGIAAAAVAAPSAMSVLIVNLVAEGEELVAAPLVVGVVAEAPAPTGVGGGVGDCDPGSAPFLAGFGSRARG